MSASAIGAGSLDAVDGVEVEVKITRDGVEYIRRVFLSFDGDAGYYAFNNSSTWFSDDKGKHESYRFVRAVSGFSF